MDINYGIGDEEVFKRDTCKMWPLLIKEHDSFLYIIYTYTFIKIIIYNNLWFRNKANESNAKRLILLAIYSFNTMDVTYNNNNTHQNRSKYKYDNNLLVYYFNYAVNSSYIWVLLQNKFKLSYNN